MCTKYAHREANSYKIVVETETKLKDTIKSVTLAAVEKPHTRDQSNKELTNFSRSWSVKHNTSSKVLLYVPATLSTLNKGELNKAISCHYYLVLF